MRRPTDRRRQWVWFAGLWLGGLTAAGALAIAVRWAMRSG
jgi:hypothetical protein